MRWYDLYRGDSSIRGYGQEATVTVDLPHLLAMIRYAAYWFHSVGYHWSTTGLAGHRGIADRKKWRTGEMHMMSRETCPSIGMDGLY